MAYVFTTAQPGTSELFQIYRTDGVGKSTTRGGVPVADVQQENGDHVYTTNKPFERTKPAHA